MRFPLILTAGLAIGILIGATMADPPSSERQLLEGSSKFKEVLTYIDQYYVDEVDTDSLVEDAIVHMLGKLDPHSVYIPAKDKIRANESLKGNFDGIGIEFNIFNDTITVIEPLNGGPSEKVGLHPGDKIITVDSIPVAGVGFTNKDVVTHLKGPKGSVVHLQVLRKGQKDLLNFEVTRDKIPQFSIEVSYIIDDDIGYMKISRFSATTYNEFKSALKKLRAKGMKKLIIDLQGNPGGYMNHAINIVDELLPDENNILFTKGKRESANDRFDARRKGELEDEKVIILVNESSASASEIVSGALQDNDRALIVGRRTYGKGLVQEAFDLNDNSELRLTISRYYTPSGRSIQKPYDINGNYGNDIVLRYDHGEFFHADSIKFNDSLKYKTKNGRTVYGGGGIMPDYFVPLDTTLRSTYLDELFYRNVIQEYTFNYGEKNNKTLKNMDYDDYYANFKVSDKMIDDLVKMGVSSGVKPDYRDLDKHKDLFKIHIKAQIARRVWNNEGFYPIYNQTNEILQQAMKLMDKTENLNKLKL